MPDDVGDNIIFDEGAVELNSAQRFVKTMRDPDDIGASEYRAIHELFTDIADNPETDAEHFNAVLDELVDWVQAIRNDLAVFMEKEAQSGRV